MKWYNLVLLILLSSIHFSCGIEEHYFLPQVPEKNITRSLNTTAQVFIPSFSNDHTTGYSIFYRIYISNFLIDSDIRTPTDRTNISPNLARDYDSLALITNPISNTVTSVNTFSNLNYYELRLETGDTNKILANLAGNGGGFITIQFPPITGNPPVMSIGGTNYTLYRSNNMGAFSPVPNRYFFSTFELNSYANANKTINADVDGRNGAISYAYASMYIVTAGVNPENFSRIYSKPTHISVFRLPNAN